MYKEVYDLVKAPLVFINSWDFQWPENIKSMQKLVKESNESGVFRSFTGIRSNALLNLRL